ncbi:uncharacterized protein LOC135833005 [Planococcus citri]|uniref:uncharacterized protein LOC135833005 n=1 Tax=Planococcus citri TaxID=170843 RepID=UPI0031F90E2D
MNENDTNTWRTPAFRNQIVTKIEEEITKWNLSTLKPSRQLENENYEKAASKEEYLKMIAKLILNMRPKPAEESVAVLSETSSEFDLNDVSATSSNGQIDSKDEISLLKRISLGKSITKRKRLLNDDEEFICAVCCSHFSSKVSLKKHINITRHMIKEALPNSIMDTIPRQWLFTVIDYFTTTDGYKMEICLPSISSVESTQEWMSEFMKYNQCVYAWERDHLNENKTRHEVVYCCQYGEKRAKSTCKSRISFTLQKGKFSYGTAMINFVHDHSIPYNDDARHCNPSAEVKQMLMKYFENSTSTVEAYRNMQLHIETQLDNENEYLEYSADRRKMPLLSWARYLYNTEYGQNNKPVTLNHQGIEFLRKFVNDKNEEQNESVCQFQELPNENFVIFIATACMRRALKSQAASELVYTDNIGSTAQYGLRVYLLLTNIKDEAVPLGIVITSSETNKAVKTGFGLLSTSLDDQSFNGKGRLGPAIIMTDDSVPEMVSMKGLFPYSKIVLSAFHFLRSCYKWLVKIEHKINKQDREIIYSYIRQMVYVEDEAELRTLFDKLVETYKNHELVSSYICKLYEKRQTWAVCYRRNFSIIDESGHATWKHTLSILKEQILNRIKLQEPKRLVSYFLNEFSEFYQRRLIDCALNRYASEKPQYENQFQNYLFVQNDHCESSFTLYDRETNVKYFINTDINICTCHVGCAGISCEHQRILRAYYENVEIRNNDSANDTKTKLELYYIVSGCRDVPEEFFGLSNQTVDNAQLDEEFKPLFDDIHTETVIDDSNSQFVSVQEISQLGAQFTEGIEIEQSTGDQNSSQVYPIIINHNDDDSVVKIEKSTLSNENKVESSPQVLYSIVFDGENVNNDVIEIISFDGAENNQSMEEIATQVDIKEERFDEKYREEAMKQELLKFNQHFARFTEMIKKNPNVFKKGLLRLNNQLARMKNDPDALFKAMNNYTNMKM